MKKKVNYYEYCLQLKSYSLQNKSMRKCDGMKILTNIKYNRKTFNHYLRKIKKKKIILSSFFICLIKCAARNSKLSY